MPTLRTSLRPLLAALALAAVGGAAALAGDPGRAAAWLALWTVPAGVLVGATTRGRSAGRGLSILALAPLCWLLLLALLHGPGGRRLADPLGGAVVLAALHLVGGCWGRVAARPWSAVSLALALPALLAGLPALAGLAGPAPWPPAVTARLLDASPVTWVLEAAGVDWMRHPALYGPAGTSAIGPELRVPFGPDLAERLLLLVSCSVLYLACARIRVRADSTDRG